MDGTTAMDGDPARADWAQLAGGAVELPAALDGIGLPGAAIEPMPQDSQFMRSWNEGHRAVGGRRVKQGNPNRDLFLVKLWIVTGFILGQWRNTPDASVFEYGIIR